MRASKNNEETGRHQCGLSPSLNTKPPSSPVPYENHPSLKTKPNLVSPSLGEMEGSPTITMDGNIRGSLPQEFKKLQQFKRSTALALQEESDSKRLDAGVPTSVLTPSDAPIVYSNASGNTATTKTNDQIPKGVAEEKKDRYKGENLIQFGLWAHYMAYCCSVLCFVFGVYSISWDAKQVPFDCSINGKPIASQYLPNSNGACNITHIEEIKQVVTMHEVCCRGDDVASLQGNTPVGAFYMVWSVLLVASEDTTLGFGLLYPNDTFTYKYKFSILAVLHTVVGIAGLTSYSTCIAGTTLLIAAAVYQYAAARRECGDGGRSLKAAAGLKALASAQDESPSIKAMLLAPFILLHETLQEYLSFLPSFKLVDPRKFFMRIYNEDKLSSYFWVTVFYLVNAIIFFSTLVTWQRAIAASQAALLNGTLDVTCNSSVCDYNRQLIKSGPMSAIAPWAKACGMCLNFDCSLLILPVIKMVLRKLNNMGESLAVAQNSTDYCAKLLSRPITRYIPIQKNIEFHKIIAFTVLFFTMGHIVAHLANMRDAENTTLQYFRKWGWVGTSFFTGAVVTLAMVFIFSGASNRMRQTKYEIFFQSHHFFLIFYFFMFLHGPNFIYWSMVPCLLYLVERYLQVWRGNQPILVTKVEWIAPVMAIYFRPVMKDSFAFKEGQYLYLNCPYISRTEWHPFTISSSQEDLSCGTRVCLATGEDVHQVPRPADLPAKAKWNKFCHVSQDYKTMDPDEYLDQSETDYNDFLSCHIRVHGLDALEAKSWTRKLKEYFEVMSGGGDNVFPCFFSRREQRGDVLMGRTHGPDGSPLLRVDGPHSAPAEHYMNYGTVMLIGAGIGLTPCASILQALSKYRWKRNFNPEILHFYWLVRQSEVDSFQWFIHMLTELSFEVKKARMAGQVDKRYYLEINIFITGVEKGTKEPQPFHRSQRVLGSPDGIGPQPYFQAEELYHLLLNPPIKSKDQISTLKSCKRFTNPADVESLMANRTANRLQDIFVWSGRPEWNDIFKEMRETRQTSDIGVCFCGPAVVGADLSTMCERYTSVKDNTVFTLHKENF